MVFDEAAPIHLHPGESSCIGVASRSCSHTMVKISSKCPDENKINSPLIFKIQSKRHQKDITFQWLFLVFFVRNLKTQGKVIKSWCLFGQKPKNTRKSHRKLMSFQRLLDWILKMRGVKYKLLNRQVDKILISWKHEVNSSDCNVLLWF